MNLVESRRLERIDSVDSSESCDAEYVAASAKGSEIPRNEEKGLQSELYDHMDDKQREAHVMGQQEEQPQSEQVSTEPQQQQQQQQHPEQMIASQLPDRLIQPQHPAVSEIDGGGHQKASEGSASSQQQAHGATAADPESQYQRNEQLNDQHTLYPRPTGHQQHEDHCESVVPELQQQQQTKQVLSQRQQKQPPTLNEARKVQERTAAAVSSSQQQINGVKTAGSQPQRQYSVHGKKLPTNGLIKAEQQRQPKKQVVSQPPLIPKQPKKQPIFNGGHPIHRTQQRSAQQNQVRSQQQVASNLSVSSTPVVKMGTTPAVVARKGRFSVFQDAGGMAGSIGSAATAPPVPCGHMAGGRTPSSAHEASVQMMNSTCSIGDIGVSNPSHGIKSVKKKGRFSIVEDATIGSASSVPQKFGEVLPGGNVTRPASESDMDIVNGTAAAADAPIVPQSVAGPTSARRTRLSEIGRFISHDGAVNGTDVCSAPPSSGETSPVGNVSVIPDTQINVTAPVGDAGVSSADSGVKTVKRKGRFILQEAGAAASATGSAPAVIQTSGKTIPEGVAKTSGDDAHVQATNGPPAPPPVGTNGSLMAVQGDALHGNHVASSDNAVSSNAQAVPRNIIVPMSPLSSGEAPCVQPPTEGLGERKTSSSSVVSQLTAPAPANGGGSPASQEDPHPHVVHPSGNVVGGCEQQSVMSAPAGAIDGVGGVPPGAKKKGRFMLLSANVETPGVTPAPVARQMSGAKQQAVKVDSGSLAALHQPILGQTGVPPCEQAQTVAPAQLQLQQQDVVNEASGQIKTAKQQQQAHHRETSLSHLPAVLPVSQISIAPQLVGVAAGNNFHQQRAPPIIAVVANDISASKLPVAATSTAVPNSPAGDAAAASSLDKPHLATPCAFDNKGAPTGVGLGKVLYFLDQMKIEVTEADRTIKRLQNDIKFLREKNKELEARSREFEKRFADEKAAREASEGKVKNLRKKVKELKDIVSTSGLNQAKESKVSPEDITKEIDGSPIEAASENPIDEKIEESKPADSKNSSRTSSPSSKRLTGLTNSSKQNADSLDSTRTACKSGSFLDENIMKSKEGFASKINDSLRETKEKDNAKQESCTLKLQTNMPQPVPMKGTADRLIPHRRTESQISSLLTNEEVSPQRRRVNSETDFEFVNKTPGSNHGGAISSNGQFFLVAQANTNDIGKMASSPQLQTSDQVQNQTSRHVPNGGVPFKAALSQDDFDPLRTSSAPPSQVFSGEAFSGNSGMLHTHFCSVPQQLDAMTLSSNVAAQTQFSSTPQHLDGMGASSTVENTKFDPLSSGLQTHASQTHIHPAHATPCVLMTQNALSNTAVQNGMVGGVIGVTGMMQTHFPIQQAQQSQMNHDGQPPIPVGMSQPCMHNSWIPQNATQSDQIGSHQQYQHVPSQFAPQNSQQQHLQQQQQQQNAQQQNLQQQPLDPFLQQTLDPFQQQQQYSQQQNLDPFEDLAFRRTHPSAAQNWADFKQNE